MQGTPNRHYQRGPTVQRYVEAVAVEAVAPASPAIYCPYSPTPSETEDTDEEPKMWYYAIKNSIYGRKLIVTHWSDCVTHVKAFPIEGTLKFPLILLATYDSYCLVLKRYFVLQVVESHLYQPGSNSKSFEPLKRPSFSFRINTCETFQNVYLLFFRRHFDQERSLVSDFGI
jgi:hypothetical protein